MRCGIELKELVILPGSSDWWGVVQAGYSVLHRKRALPKLPNTYKLAKEAKQLLEEIEPEEQYESEEQYTSKEQSESE